MATISINGVDVEAPSTANTDRWQDAFTPILEAMASAVDMASAAGGTNVKSFGAVGDGVADDSDAIRAAVAGSLANRTNHVHFPSGTYRLVPKFDGIESHVLVNVPSNFTLSGEGYKSIVKLVGDVDGEGSEPGGYTSFQSFYAEEASNILFKSLHFVGMNDPFEAVQQAQSAAISFGANVEDVMIQDCVFDDMFGFTAHAGFGGPSTGGSQVRIHLINNLMRNCANGPNVCADYSQQTGNVLVNCEGFEFTGGWTNCSDNIIKDGLSSGVSVGGAGLYAPGMKVSNNIIDGSPGVGIAGGDCFVDGMISGNTIRHCLLGGISIHETGEEGWSISSRNIIDGNNVYDCGSAGASYGIWIAGTGGHSITNNRVTTGQTGGSGTYRAVAIVMNSGLLLDSPNNIVAGNSLRSSAGQIDLVLTSNAVGTTLGENELCNGAISMAVQGSATVLPRDRRGAAASDAVEMSHVSGDNYPQWQRYVSGKMEWGTSALLLDTNLYRNNPDQLKTDDEMVSGIGFAVGAQKIRNAATIPIAGTWLQGDIVFKTDPVSGGFIGWVCTVAGTPGTWKTWGVIS